MIDGVAIKELVRHHDERGWFQEIIRSTDAFFTPGFGQWSMSLMHQGTIKAWHVHDFQWDWWMVPSGSLKLVLHDLRSIRDTYHQTEEYLLGDGYPPRVVAIPPGVAHGCKVLQGPAVLMYITSRVYNPDDEGRIAYDDPTIGYDWLKGPAIT